MLRVPTPGAGFCGARQVPRPLLLPGFVTGDGVSGTTTMSGSGVLGCARGGVKLHALLDVTPGAPRRPLGAVVRVPV